jgi:molybdopterin synthase sulfur carrier subunit
VIRVILPPHLRTLAHVDREIAVEVDAPVTQGSVLDAVEREYPMLLDTMRDRRTGKRRPLVRFFACEEDLSNESPDTPLPDRVAKGEEPFMVVGAMAGG